MRSCKYVIDSTAQTAKIPRVYSDFQVACVNSLYCRVARAMHVINILTNQMCACVCASDNQPMKLWYPKFVHGHCVIVCLFIAMPVSLSTNLRWIIVWMHHYKELGIEDKADLLYISISTVRILSLQFIWSGV